jgi:retron-type reverse transcriptase
MLDLDVRAFFDSVPHDLMLKAVAHHTDERWVLLYIERWLKAPMQMPDGSLVAREKGTPQGSLCAAEHKDPYEQYRVMRSVGLSGLVRTGSAAVRCA